MGAPILEFRNLVYVMERVILLAPCLENSDGDRLVGDARSSTGDETAPEQMGHFQALVGQGFKRFPMGQSNVFWEPPFRSLDKLLACTWPPGTPGDSARARQSIWTLASWRLSTSVPVKPRGPAFPPTSLLPNPQP